MRKFSFVVLAALLVGPATAEAKGCIKGALVGGVAGHYAGHHAVAGAIAGCAIGRHEANKSRNAATPDDRTGSTTR
jgi:uncharacterized protein YcfJ